MSQMFYAALAGERGKKAAAASRLADENYEAAKSWEDSSKKWQQNATQWKEHALALRSKVVEWQKSAIESEAISRVQGQLMIDKHGVKVSEYVGAKPHEVEQLINEKKEEVIKEWGVNPWSDK